MNRQFATWIAHPSAKWVALVVMLAVVGGFGFFAKNLTGVLDNQVENWLPGNAESTKVIKQSEQFADPEEIPLVLVYERDSGLLPTDMAAVSADLARVVKVANVMDDAVGPIPSQDGQAIQAIVKVHVNPVDGWNKLPETIDAIDKATQSTDGLSVEFAGPVAFAGAQADAFGELDTRLLFSAVGIVVVLLLLTYRSPVLWLFPLLGGLASVGAATGIVYLLAKYAGLTVNAQSQGILNVLILGASVDYALLLVARYREELHNFADPHAAMAHALHRAAPAIIASGLTVALGMLCLVAADMNPTASLGPVLATGIGIALLVMLVLLPVMLLTRFPVSLILLAVLGLPTLVLWLLKRSGTRPGAERWHGRLWAALTGKRWIFWPFVPRADTPDRQASGLWARVGNGVAKAPRLVWVTTAVTLGVATLGIFQLNANGLANDEQFVSTPDYIHASKTLAEHFPAGGGSPIQVIAKTDAVDSVKAAFAGVDGVVPESVAIRGAAGDVSYLEGTMIDLSGSKKAKETVDAVRDAVHAVPGADAIVGGESAVIDDSQTASARDNRVIIPLVLAVILLVLGVLLRSIVAPVLLLGTVILSFGAALGISALIFRHALGFPGADSSFPLFVFVFLVALGVDYNIFLMTRVREESLLHGTRKGSLVALAATGGVITSAGLVLAGTFSALATMPMVFMAELGFAVALGVILDTFIVRSVLVTALNLDIGRHIWWPSKLAKLGDEATEPKPALVKS